MPKPWKKHSSQVVSRHRIFDVISERFSSPRTGKDLDATIIAAPDWVNVVAFTEQGHCLLVRQYRFGTDAVTLEIPGGIIDPGEAPLAAAMRELREETGYEAERWIALGSLAPNPAFQRNRIHSFLAEGCRRVGELELDPGEDIEVELLPADRLDALVAAGGMDHALAVVALYKVALHRRGLALV